MPEGFSLPSDWEKAELGNLLRRSERIEVGSDSDHWERVLEFFVTVEERSEALGHVTEAT